MNYYIEGCAAKAEEISAVFEKLGYDTSRHLFNAKSVLYFTLDGEIRITTCNCTPAIIKTHPDYQELPIEPNFKVGDWIVDKYQLSEVFNVSKVLDHTYEIIDKDGCDYHVPHYKAEEDYRFWTIEDAKDGDVLVTTKIRNCPFIYRRTGYNDDLAYYYAGVDGNGNFCEGCLKRTLYHFGPVANVAPATKEQRNLLFAKMKEAGYQWDADKKELRKIKSHYNISNFHAGMPVLVRDDNGDEWNYLLFSHYRKKLSDHFFAGGSPWFQCIPFNGDTKHLLGTTDPCDERYVNW